MSALAATVVLVLALGIALAVAMRSAKRARREGAPDPFEAGRRRAAERRQRDD